MEIIHNAEMTHKFAEIILKKQIQLSKDRSGYHRSDTISCPMKCYNRMTGMEGKFDERQIGYFLLGRIAHIALEENFDVSEKAILVANKVWVTIDMVQGKYPIEAKTTRRKIYRKDQIPRDWFEQLAFAMSTLGTTKGYLLVVNVISFAVMVWEITMEEREIKIYKGAMLAKLYTLVEAEEKKRPDILEISREECPWCQYRPRHGYNGCIRYNPLPKKEKGSPLD